MQLIADFLFTDSLAVGWDTSNEPLALERTERIPRSLNEPNLQLVSIPAAIFIVVIIIIVGLVIQQKLKYQSGSEDESETKRFMPLELQRQNSVRSKRDVDSISGPRPLRNLSEESELTRSLVASTSSEQEDEGSSRKKPSTKKKGANREE
ncbi:unnamed protein product [Gongylonema pulchrum]|uniref:Small integral membrane protein 24 n=1 Tax=Gongylonema pulchrum TaxID=637853 RepID=A0A183EBW2_9BILA|nr:unnamed protein product [Gongylonema pulchrum]